MKKIFKVLFLLCLVVSIIFIFLFKFSWRFNNNIKTISRIGLNNLSFKYDIEGKNVSFPSDGLKIVGDIYTANDDLIKPGIILVHGASPWGRKLALYRLIASQLSKKGYIVLNIDIRGFGESDDPHSWNDRVSMDESRDVINAVNYLTSLNHVDKNKIFIIGHSHGGSLAIIAGVEDERINKIVSIGPGRRIKERLRKEFDEFRKRYSHDRNIDYLIEKDMVYDYISSLTMENYIDYFNSHDHKPILLIDGQLESMNDRLFMKEYYSKITPPKAYVTIFNTDHYKDCINFAGGKLLFFNKKKLSELIDIIDAWLKLP